LGKVLSYETVEKMQPPARAALLAALKVDALGFVRVRLSVGRISGVSIGGIGKTEKHPKAVIELKVFDATTADPVWQERYAQGQPSEAGIARTMGIDSDENETAAMLEALTLATSVLGTNYQEAKAKPVEK